MRNIWYNLKKVRLLLIIADMLDRKKTTVLSTLKRIPFLSVLSDKELAEVERAISVKRYSKNEAILLEDNIQDYMYIVYSGRVKAIQSSSEGKEHILAIHKQGEFFGEMSLLDGRTSPASVIAMEDTDIGFLSKENFRTHLMSKEKVVRELNSMLCFRLREAWLKLKVLSFADAEKKIRAVLKLLSEQKGIHEMRGVIISLRLTHQDLADYAALSRETVTRIMDRLLKEDEIEILDNRNILLKPVFFKLTRSL